MAAYQLTYAGVTLQVSHFTQWDSVSVMSDDQTTKLYNQITMTCQGTVNTAYTGLSNAAYIRTLRTQLSEPRQPLNVLFGNVAVVNSNGIDAKNGPIVEKVTVNEFRNATLMVALTITTFISECDASGYQPSPVISNRWEQSAHYDDEGYCTLRSSGQLVVRSDAQVNPDTFRDQITPINTIPNGFVRVDFEPAITSDGLVFQWTVTDREHYRPPTFGVFKYEARWRETTDYAESALVTGTFEAAASSNKAMSKDQLLNWLIQVASSRIDFTKDIMRSSDMEESIHHNEVKLRVVVYTAVQNTDANFQITTRIGSKVPIMDNNASQRTVMTSRGTYNANLFVNYLASTCDSKTNSQTPPSTSGQKPTKRNQDYQIITGPQSTTGTTKTSAQQLKNPYVKAQIEANIIDDYHIIQMPVANGSTQAPAAFAQTAAPTSKKIVRYSYERLGDFPECPAKITDSNHLLAQRQLIGSQLDILPDGVTKLYTIKGEDTYYLKNCSQIGTNGLTLPRSPTDATPLQDSSRVISSSTFSPNIVA